MEITFRDGRELLSPKSPGAGFQTPAESGLASHGEFGPEAAIVLVDLADHANGSVHFHHWETTAMGPAAVFHYSVAAAGSHYQVQYDCDKKTPFRAFPGYHGSIMVNPATGAILRLTLATELKEGDPISEVTSTIEYGPVKIGERAYICPLESIASITVEENACAHRTGPKRLAEPQVLVNHSTFSEYHRFGSTLTIVPKAEDGTQGPG